MVLYYQVDYILTDLDRNAAYFHAQYRRINPLPFRQDYVKGKGQYVGTDMAYGSHRNGWWGEGEIEFFMYGDTQYPTICSTGTEDHFAALMTLIQKRKMKREIETSASTEFCTPCTVVAPVILRKWIL